LFEAKLGLRLRVPDLSISNLIPAQLSSTPSFDCLFVEEFRITDYNEIIFRKCAA